MIMLSNPYDYYRQDNDGTPLLLGAYHAEAKYVACGVSSFLCAMSIKGYELTPSPYLQEEDYVMMILYNPKNRKDLIKSTGIQFKDFDCVQEYKAVYPWLAKKLFNLSFKYKVTKDANSLWHEIITEIKSKKPVMTAGDFKYGGHYVCFVGYDESTDELIYNDPYPKNYDDLNGYARRLNYDEFVNNIFKRRNDYLS